MPPGMSARYAFFFGLRFSLFFGLLSPMGYLLTGDESLANRDSAQDLLSAYLRRHYTCPGRRSST